MRQKRSVKKKPSRTAKKKAPRKVRVKPKTKSPIEKSVSEPIPTPKDVRESRTGVYGSPTIMQECLAYHWTAIMRAYLQNPDAPAIPPRLVGLMLAALKLHRISVDSLKPDPDSYVDIHNYIDFAMEVDDTLPRME